MRTRVLVVGFVVSLSALTAACSLNPQPEPPGSSSDVTSGTPGAGGASSTGKGGSQGTAAGAAGSPSVGGTGAGGNPKGTGGGTAGSFPGKGGAGGNAGSAGASGKGGAGVGGSGFGAGGAGAGTGGGIGGGAGGAANGGGAGTGSGTAGASGSSGLGGNGGGGGASADTPISGLSPAISATCKQCLESMKGAPAANAMVDCGSVAAACGPQDQGCNAAIGCIANAISLHPSAKLDCAVATCTSEIGTEPAANDFLSCLADKCGAPCDASVGFADTAMCPP